MKKYILIFLFLNTILSSCNEEFVCERGVNCPEDFIIDDSEDPIIDDNEENQIEIDPDIIFTDQEGNQFATGIDCENPSPDYQFSPDILVVDLEIPETMPPEFDLGNLVPPIGNQGKQGSCVSWAVTYYMKSIQEKFQYNHSYDLTTLMSPAYTYNQLAKGACGGTNIVATLEILKEQGTTNLAAFPYIENDCSIQPEENTIDAASSNKILEYKNLSGENMVAEMKALLTSNIPIIISAILDSEFGKKDFLGLTSYREHEIDYTKAACHAMTVVGYSDLNNAFKVANSWGSDWGDGGFVWIDYKAFENVLKTEESFRVITSAHIAIDIP